MTINELREKIEILKEKLARVEKSVDFAGHDRKIKEIEKKMEKPDFWGNPDSANAVIKELKTVKVKIEPWREFLRQHRELEELTGIIDEKDESSVKELESQLKELEKKYDELEVNLLLSGEFDANDAILSIHAGAGGTESCDWVAMLFRMYRRWAEGRKYKVQVVDYLAGEEAGIKSVTVFVRGDYAFGYMKSEAGVHRLVRISPFDANKRRHTSFASVDVIADVKEDIDVEINEKDVRVDVYRATGPGGQGVNTTDSAVRITHLPTGIVVQCQNERSQIRNRATAMKILKARVYELEKKKREEQQAKEYAAKQEIAWGSQIRSYVLHPYNMIKDHRTKVEVGNTGAVLDGDIDRFIEGYLRMRVKG